MSMLLAMRPAQSSDDLIVKVHNLDAAKCEKHEECRREYMLGHDPETRVQELEVKDSWTDDEEGGNV